MYELILCCCGIGSSEENVVVVEKPKEVSARSDEENIGDLGEATGVNIHHEQEAEEATYVTKERETPTPAKSPMKSKKQRAGTKSPDGRVSVLSPNPAAKVIYI